MAEKTVAIAGMIDAHIHLDLYGESAAREMLERLPEAGVDRVVAVSLHLESCMSVHKLYEAYPQRILPAYGFHPERPELPERELERLLSWIRLHAREMAAVGEVGLPYYKRQEALEKGEPFALEPYVELLDTFVALAKELDKPIVLHAVYEDADIACDVLERHGVARAHFHWFKGSRRTVQRMMDNGYYVSFTPDIAYEDEIRTLAGWVPTDRMMAETDGPWPFEGPFAGMTTHPRMVRAVIERLGELKGLPAAEMAAIVRRNTETLYGC